MTLLLTLLQWGISLILLLLAAIVLGMGGKLQALLLLLAALASCPAVTRGISTHTGTTLPAGIQIGIVLTFLAGVVISIRILPATSLYKSPRYREQLLTIYNEKLSQWPTPYESRHVDTEYGKIHVIISGPEDGYPVLMINASGVAGWSWMFNTGALNRRYRTYAVDNIGEAGKNEMTRPGHIPRTGEEIARYYADITEQLGFSRSHVIGASIGGFISTNYALYAPERVNRLVLLGSMGYGFTPKTVATLMIAQSMPIKPVQEATFAWAFGNAPHVLEAFGPWFRIVMKGMVPTPIAPRSFTPGELGRIKAHTLTYIGTRDAVVGNSERAAALARNIPDTDVRIVNSGHLIGAELAPEVNEAILEFFDRQQ